MLPVPQMDYSDDRAANRVLQSFGLPDLPPMPDAADAGAGTSAGSSHNPIRLFQMPGMGTAITGDGQQNDLQFSFSPTAVPLNTSLTEVGGHGEGAMSFSDWSQGYFDKSTKPDWVRQLSITLL